jgi:hypothetical protein
MYNGIFYCIICILNWQSFQVGFVNHELVILSYVIIHIIHFEMSYIKDVKRKYLCVKYNIFVYQCVSVLMY